MAPHRYRMAIPFGIALALGSVASAQEKQPDSGSTEKPPQGTSRIELGLAFAQSLGTSTFSSSQTLRKYAEDGTLNSSYKVGGAPGGGLDLQYNLGARFGVRLGAQTFSRKSGATFDARIPHPFFFARPRDISGSRSGLGFSETAVSLTGVYRRGSGKWTMSLEGGPAVFRVKATVAEEPTYAEAYPYDAATFSGIVSSEKKASPFGFAVGLEIGRQITSSVSVVALGRFVQGSSDLDLKGQKIPFTAGGAQARLGLRFVLARKRASP